MLGQFSSTENPEKNLWCWSNNFAHIQWPFFWAVPNVGKCREVPPNQQKHVINPTDSSWLPWEINRSHGNCGVPFLLTRNSLNMYTIDDRELNPSLWICTSLCTEIYQTFCISCNLYIIQHSNGKLVIFWMIYLREKNIVLVHTFWWTKTCTRW